MGKLYDLLELIIKRVNVTVRTYPQYLSENEKRNARNNIGIVGTGKDGKDGYTPQKNVDYFDGKTPVKYEDYWTEADKLEIVNTVLEQVPDPDEDLRGAVITATGDSTVAAGTGESTVGGYVRLIADMYGMEYENVAVGGGTVASGIVDADGKNRFAICDSISSMRSDADIILLSGGVNDQAMMNHEYEYLGKLTPDFTTQLNKATFYGAMEYLLRQAVYRWSNKTILFVIPHRMTKNLQYRDAIHAACEKYGIPVVDLMETTPDFYYLNGFRDEYTANGDGWHADEDGYLKFYVPQIVSAICNNFRGKGETVTLTDSSMPDVVCIPGPVDAMTVKPEIAGFIRTAGTISTSANYKRTDYLPLDGFTEAEYTTFVVSGSGMATWALFDADKKWLVSSEDVNGTDYYTVSATGSALSYGLLKRTISITELLKSHPTAKYIVLSTCNNADFEVVKNQNGEDVGWGSTEQYITLTSESSSDAPGGLPPVTEADNGKFLQVVNGAWAAADKTEMVNAVLAALPTWTGGSY